MLFPDGREVNQQAFQRANWPRRATRLNPGRSRENKEPSSQDINVL